ncbi:MAG: hypothetical protein LBI28_14150 [Treponema sp.]|jgi:hypothetical protein|nr:hypothetical protein [Treponema sp.]
MALPNDNIFENDRYDNILVDFDINYGRTFDNISILNIKVFAPYASNNNVYLTAR